MTSGTIFVVSGGKGSSGEQLVRTALAQFHDSGHISVEIVSDVRHIDQLQRVVDRAHAEDGLIVHTLVNAELRESLTELTRANHVPAVDLMGPLLVQLSSMLGQRPLGQPGLYRQLRDHYFKRIEAIEFTVEHDDGRRVQELDQAEIVLTGVSRVGKTPLSMFLSTRGWKVANVPLIPGVEPPAQLFEIDHRRVVGLIIEPGQLVAYRQHRQQHLGVAQKSDYTEPTELYAEIEYARAIFRRGRFAILDMTDRPIEESADEIVAQVTRRLRSD